MKRITDNSKQNEALGRLLNKHMDECEEDKEKLLKVIVEMFTKCALEDSLPVLEENFGKDFVKEFLSIIVQNYDTSD